jgi:hypothetical protein
MFCLDLARHFVMRLQLKLQPLDRPPTSRFRLAVLTNIGRTKDAVQLDALDIVTLTDEPSPMIENANARRRLSATRSRFHQGQRLEVDGANAGFACRSR